MIGCHCLRRNYPTRSKRVRRLEVGALSLAGSLGVDVEPRLALIRPTVRHAGQAGYGGGTPGTLTNPSLVIGTFTVTLPVIFCSCVWTSTALLRNWLIFRLTSIKLRERPGGHFSQFGPRVAMNGPCTPEVHVETLNCNATESLRALNARVVR